MSNQTLTLRPRGSQGSLGTLDTSPIDEDFEIPFPRKFKEINEGHFTIFGSEILYYDDHEDFEAYYRKEMSVFRLPPFHKYSLQKRTTEPVPNGTYGILDRRYINFSLVKKLSRYLPKYLEEDSECGEMLTRDFKEEAKATLLGTEKGINREPYIKKLGCTLNRKSSGCFS